FQQSIGEEIDGLLRELIIGADIGEARALPCQVLLDIDHDLSGELIAGQHGDGPAETVTCVTRDQASRGIGDFTLVNRGGGVWSGFGPGWSWFPRNCGFHRPPFFHALSANSRCNWGALFPVCRSRSSVRSSRI